MLPGKRPAVERGVAPHTRKQRVLAATSKLRSAFFTGYKKKICTYCTYHNIYIHDSQLNRPESVSLASLARQLCMYMYVCICMYISDMHAGVSDRNSIATKREEFPARDVEVASSRLLFASLTRLLQLLQQTYPTLCQQPEWNSIFIHYRRVKRATL